MELVDAHVVFVLQNFICQLCGERIDAALEFPHPEAAVLDHKLPVAHGGTTTWDNVQTAHNRCNLEKGCKIRKVIIQRPDGVWDVGYR